MKDENVRSAERMCRTGGGAAFRDAGGLRFSFGLAGLMFHWW